MNFLAKIHKNVKQRRLLGLVMRMKNRFVALDIKFIKRRKSDLSPQAAVLQIKLKDKNEHYYADKYARLGR